MTYTVATRPAGSTNQFVPLAQFMLMSLADAQVVAREFRAAGHDAVAFNTQGV
jgi:hypothetical protein